MFFTYAQSSALYLVSIYAVRIFVLVSFRPRPVIVLQTCPPFPCLLLPQSTLAHSP